MLINDKRDTSLEPLKWLTPRLLALLSGMAGAGSNELAVDFRAQLREYTSAIQGGRRDEPLDTIVRKCLALCQDFFEQEESAKIKPDVEYAAIIDVLREALAMIVGQEALAGSVLGSAVRFRELAKIEDIAILRKTLNEEVRCLEQTVHDSQAAQNASIRALTERVDSLEQKLTQTSDRLTTIETESSLDALTRIYNRKHFDTKLQEWISLKPAKPFVLAMVDVDDFKRINDVHGHQVGDEALQAIAQRLRSHIRAEDVLARYGGEEFVILLHNISGEQAEARCNSVLEAVRSPNFEYTRKQTSLSLKLSVSCGMTEYVPGESAQDVVHRADLGLYQAKRSGKDRVVHRSAKAAKKSVLLSLM